MNRFFLVSCLLSFVSYSLFAEDCMRYKTLPSLKIKVPAFSVYVTSPDRPMDLLHGNVVATLAEEYEIEYGAARSLGEGWCVFIEGITVEMGYTDFVVQVDKRHNPESCEFKRILEHEDEHVAAHLAVIRDEGKNIRAAISAAANNVLPIFARNENEIDDAMNELETKLQNRPEIRLLRQKLAAEREIRNKKIDMNDRGERIRSCAAE